MKLPLFISAKSFVGLGSMRVRIGKGEWRFSNESDSKLHYFLDNEPLTSDQFRVEGDSRVYCIVVESGAKPLNVYIETCNGTDTNRT